MPVFTCYQPPSRLKDVAPSGLASHAKGVILDPPGNPAAFEKVQASLECLLNTKGGENMAVKILPTFKGYTVDLRLQEFRRAKPGPTLEIIHFLSPEGWNLFAELWEFAKEVVEFYDYK